MKSGRVQMGCSLDDKKMTKGCIMKDAKGSIMKEEKMIKGRIMKKTRIPRSNILRNIISKKKEPKHFLQQKYYLVLIFTLSCSFLHTVIVKCNTCL